jgi:hypothetical protein
MTSENLLKQIETYSNAIIAFTVLQGLAYSYAFGTSEHFNCAIKTASYLAEGMVAIFAAVGTLSVVATVWLGRVVEALSGEFRSNVAKIYWGKVTVIAIFSLIPLVLTYAYGVNEYPGKRECKTVEKRG